MVSSDTLKPLKMLWKLRTLGSTLQIRDRRHQQAGRIHLLDTEFVKYLLFQTLLRSTSAYNGTSITHIQLCFGTHFLVPQSETNQPRPWQTAGMVVHSSEMASLGMSLFPFIITIHHWMEFYKGPYFSFYWDRVWIVYYDSPIGQYQRMALGL